MAVVAGSIPITVRLRLEIQSEGDTFVEAGYIGAEINLPLVVGESIPGSPVGNIRIDTDEFNARLEAATRALASTPNPLA